MEGEGPLSEGGSITEGSLYRGSFLESHSLEGSLSKGPLSSTIITEGSFLEERLFEGRIPSIEVPPKTCNLLAIQIHIFNDVTLGITPVESVKVKVQCQPNGTDDVTVDYVDHLGAIQVSSLYLGGGAPFRPEHEP